MYAISRTASYRKIQICVLVLKITVAHDDTGLNMSTPSDYLCMPRTLFVNWLNNNNEPDLWFGQCVYLSVTKVKVRKYYSFLGLS